VAFDFPASPIEGQSYVPAGGPAYSFKSGVWMASAIAVPSPVGSIIYVPAMSPPDNYLRINGALLSRTAYAALWNYANLSGNIVADALWSGAHQGAFSFGDGSTNFRLPDDRGVFIRSWDDSRGIDFGRDLGGWQADAYLNHTHTAQALPTHDHTTTTSSTYASGPSAINQANVTSTAQRTGTATKSTSLDTAGTPVINASTTGGAETRPHNNARLACIRYQ
jgi:microcystin-dependent protein